MGRKDFLKGRAFWTSVKQDNQGPIHFLQNRLINDSTTHPATDYVNKGNENGQ